MTYSAEPFYLDYNASAPLRAEVRTCILAALRTTGNASSVHSFGRRARANIEAARESVAEKLDASVEGVVFTGSGSEANALALHDKDRFFCSAGEHASVLAWQHDAQAERRLVPLLPDGIVDVQALKAMLDAPCPPPLVSVMAANNETGVLQPVEKMGEICRARDILFHSDATQAVGRLPVSLKAWGADMITCSAHKLGGPQGIGALVCTKKARARLVPLLRGGGQEGGLRAGTEQVAAVLGFAKALSMACEELENMQEVQAQRDAFEKELQARIEGVKIAGGSVPRLANTSCFVHPSLEAEVVLMLCDGEGIALSSGAACSSGKVAPSHVLRAMGFGEADCRRAIRVSFGMKTPTEALAALIDVLARKENSKAKNIRGKTSVEIGEKA